MRGGSMASASPLQTAGVLTWPSLLPDEKAPEARGGMGTVFRARWERRRLDVAVKLLRASELSADEYAAAVVALTREAELLRLASEGGVNRFVVVQYGVVRGRASDEWRKRLGDTFALYASRVAGGGGERTAVPSGELFGLVMAWQGGGTLAQRLHGPVRWAAKTAERLLLLEHAADGVALLHSAQPQMVVHGDIKSENVLLTSAGDAAEPRLSDFGLAEVKRSVATSGGGSVHIVDGNRAGGTWPYMAPEMTKSRGVAARAASPTTDVYALTTLCWEVLVGARPWENYTDLDRSMALRDGENLDFARLPGEAPPALASLLRRGVAFAPSACPSARELCDGLRLARELIESGRFDVFLSHCWDGAAHAPATTFVLRALRESGVRVWVDLDQMGHALEVSMREGIVASTVVVALVSRRYAASKNCMLELRAARETGKAIVSCLVEPDDKWWPPTSATTDNERELAAAINPAALMFADLRKACTEAKWASASGSLPVSQRALLNASDAVPKLLQLVCEKLGKARSGPAAAAMPAAIAR